MYSKSKHRLQAMQCHWDNGILLHHENLRSLLLQHTDLNSGLLQLHRHAHACCVAAAVPHLPTAVLVV
jgi:hypothetical protein